MSPIATVSVDTDLDTIEYRGFTIEESIDGWEWSHWDCNYAPTGPNGTCRTVFECIDAVDDWYAKGGAPS